MSYPRRKDLFVAWSKAMVEGSTIDKPNYSPATLGTKRASKGRAKPQRLKRRRRRKKVHHGSKD